MTQTWATMLPDGNYISVIPPASTHPRMLVGLVVNGTRLWLTREEACDLGKELIKQSKGGRL